MKRVATIVCGFAYSIQASLKLFQILGISPLNIFACSSLRKSKRGSISAQFQGHISNWWLRRDFRVQDKEFGHISSIINYNDRTVLAAWSRVSLSIVQVLTPEKPLNYIFNLHSLSMFGNIAIPIHLLSCFLLAWLPRSFTLFLPSLSEMYLLMIRVLTNF